jgi:hypothetical protein
MAIARGVRQFTYVLEEERSLPPEKQTRWHLRTLTYSQAEDVGSIEVQQDQFGQRRITTNAIKWARLVLNFGLHGWENFRDESGKEIEFRVGSSCDHRALPNDILDLIRPTWAIELADQIRNEANLDLETAKNC